MGGIDLPPDAYRKLMLLRQLSSADHPQDPRAKACVVAKAFMHARV